MWARVGRVVLARGDDDDDEITWLQNPSEELHYTNADT